MLEGVTAVGFRAHMGWADSVVLTVSKRGATVGPRAAVDLRPRTGPVHPYHAASEVPMDERDRLVARCLQEAEATAIQALEDLLTDGVQAIGVVISPGVRHAPIDRILASSRLLHMAEATVYQQAVRGAAAALRLPCATPTFAQAERHDLWPAVLELGRGIGPPWRKDNKFAALAAWLAARLVGPEGG